MERNLEKEITVTLSVPEWNAVVSGLASRPYAEVAQLIEKVANQVSAQMKSAEANTAA